MNGVGFNTILALRLLTLKLVAKTLFGLEPILAQELKDLGAKNTVVLNRAVEFEGNQELIYHANLALRTALRILVPVTNFQAHNDRHLYSLAGKVNWEKYLTLDQTFVIDSTANSKRFTHSQYAAQKVKDAIVDQFKAKTGKRPSVSISNPDVRINLHISENDVNIALDSSGESLEKRGYRNESNEAPISEVLAAAIVLFAGWDQKVPLLDAMTGSGTIAIEAALITTNSAPGLHRAFAFQNWMDYDKALFDRLQLELRNAITQSDAKILARDIDASTISIAKRNAMRAGVIDNIAFECIDFNESLPFSDSALMLMNPPYGERLDDPDEMIEFYHQIGFRLKHFYENHTAWVISSNLAAMKRLGLKPDERIKLFNGSLECRLNKYSLFKGKRIDQTQH